MKMFNLLAVMMVSLAALSACSGNSTPATTTQAVVANPNTNVYGNGVNGVNGVYGANGIGVGAGVGAGVGVGVNAGFSAGFNIGINPYLTANGANYAQLGAQGQLNLQTGANNLLSCAARATPNFYKFTSSTSNCAVRQQPTYTPTSCACVKAPCDCEQVVNQTRNQCLFPPTTTTTTTVDCNTNPSGINANSKILPLSITGLDAKALYDRLQKAAQALNNATKTMVRTGYSYKCMMDQQGNRANDYACDFDVSEADGMIYEQFPVDQSGNAVISGTANYSGPNVTVGGSSLGSFEALITFGGSPAKVLYGKMKAKTLSGRVDGCTDLKAKIKVGTNVMCYETTSDGDSYTCSIRVNAQTGEIEAPMVN